MDGAGDYAQGSVEKVPGAEPRDLVESCTSSEQVGASQKTRATHHLEYTSCTNESSPLVFILLLGHCICTTAYW